MASTTKTFRLEVRAASTPAWLSGLTPGVWSSLATTLESVKPSPLPSVPGYSNDFAAICNGWTGACVNANSGEYIMAANGGHADYAGNEIYAVNMYSDSPQWQRVKEPSPPPLRSDTLPDQTSAPAVNDDGAMRAVHGWNRCVFGNNRVWYPCQDAYTSGGGPTQYTCMFLDWNTKVWNSAGALPGASYLAGRGASVYDSRRNLVWTFGGAQNPSGLWKIDAATGAISTRQGTGTQAIVDQSWAVYCTNLDLIVAGTTDENGLTTNQLLVFDPATETGSLRPFSGGWTGQGANGETIKNCSGPQLGGVYDQAVSRIYVGCPSVLGSALRVLDVPLSGGAYDPAGTFAWRLHTPSSGLTPQYDANYQGTYRKLQLVTGPGGWQALVLACSTSRPLYVLRLPATGL